MYQKYLVSHDVKLMLKQHFLNYVMIIIYFVKFSSQNVRNLVSTVDIYAVFYPHIILKFIDVFSTETKRH